MNKKVKKQQLSDGQSQKSQKSNNDDVDIQQNQEKNVPKIDRNLMYKADFTKIIINIAFTKYPVIKLVAEKLKMQINDEPKDPDWDVCWTDFMIMPRNFIRMHFHQTINYIPGISAIARKNFLGRNLNDMKIKFPTQYNFHPQTWMLPQDFPILRKYLSINKGETMIVKPQADCQGRGIYLINKIEDLRRKGKHCIIQKYIQNPLLIDGFKFDLRIYVLIGSIDPLRIYLYNDGLARFATQKYQIPNQDNFSLNFQHLTNYAINKLNPKFKASKSGVDGQSGFKRSLKSIMKTLGQLGVDTNNLWQKIKDISVKTILTCYHQIKHNYISSQPEQYHNRMCFHILGLDIMINQQFQPILLEVNHTPSFATETPLDHKIKFNLIKNTLQLLQCHNLKLKETLFSKSLNYCSNRIQNGKIQQYNEQIRNKQLQKNMYQRIQLQKQSLDGYQIIFPHSNKEINKKYHTVMQETKKMFYFNMKNRSYSEKQVCNKEIKKVYKERNRERQIQQTLVYGSQLSKYQDKEKQHLLQSIRMQSSQDALSLTFSKNSKCYSMYGRKKELEEAESIHEALKALFNKEATNSTNHRKHPLHNITYKNPKSFSIKIKYSISDVRTDLNNNLGTLSKELQKKRDKKSNQRVSSNNKIANRQKQGMFLQPKMYKVPDINPQDVFIDLKTIYRAKVKLRSINRN